MFCVTQQLILKTYFNCYHILNKWPSKSKTLLQSWISYPGSLGSKLSHISGPRPSMYFRYIQGKVWKLKHETIFICCCLKMLNHPEEYGIDRPDSLWNTLAWPMMEQSSGNFSLQRCLIHSCNALSTSAVFAWCKVFQLCINLGISLSA
jgi:hypothetical protein